MYPGSFDPVTYGHLNIIERSLQIFDRVVVAVLDNPSKQTLFTMEERMHMIRESTAQCHGVDVDSFQGLLMDYMANREACVVVRGLRAVSDFEYEFQMALMNRKLNRKVQTIFLLPSLKYIFTSSSIIKQVTRFGGNAAEFVPPVVCRMLKEKFGKIPARGNVRPETLNNPE